MAHPHQAHALPWVQVVHCLNMREKSAFISLPYGSACGQVDLPASHRIIQNHRYLERLRCLSFESRTCATEESKKRFFKKANPKHFIVLNPSSWRSASVDYMWPGRYRLRYPENDDNYLSKLEHFGEKFSLNIAAFAATERRKWATWRNNEKCATGSTHYIHNLLNRNVKEIPIDDLYIRYEQAGVICDFLYTDTICHCLLDHLRAQKWHLPQLLYVREEYCWVVANSGLKGLAADALALYVVINVALPAPTTDLSEAWPGQIQKLFSDLRRHDEDHRWYWTKNYSSLFQDIYPNRPRRGQYIDQSVFDSTDEEDAGVNFFAELKQLNKDLFRILYLIEALLLEWEDTVGEQALHGTEKTQFWWKLLFLSVMEQVYHLKVDNTEFGLDHMY